MVKHTLFIVKGLLEVLLSHKKNEKTLLLISSAISTINQAIDSVPTAVL